MQVIYHPEAEKEMMDAAVYYESQADNLGFKFLQDLDNVIRSIVEFPDTWPIVYEDIRRHLFSHFPFAVLFRITVSEIRIIAVMNLHRKPGYWNERV